MTTTFDNTLAGEVRGFRVKMREVIGALIANPKLKASNQSLGEQLRAWDDALAKVERDAKTTPEVAIALVGGTGAGKSTLLNALLGVRLLPTSTVKACTAAISEIRYSDAGVYTAEVEFLTRDEWNIEVAMLRADMTDFHNTSGDAEFSNGRNAVEDVNRAALDKINAVYGPESTDQDDVTVRSSASKGAVKIDLNKLIEPPEIARALDIGKCRFEARTSEDFASDLQKYLSSRYRFWPIVKRVRIEGPFEALQCGAAVIDLPGINDPNAAREEVTRNYLKTSKFLWLVFNMKRSLTKDTVLLMQSDEFRRIVMDGKANSVSFVGTHSDDVNFDSACEELGLDNDATDKQIVAARNKRVASEVKAQLVQLVGELTSVSDSPERAQSLIDTFRKAPIFTVSAADYLSLSLKARRRPVLETEHDTEIPLLKVHLEDTCVGFDVAAYYRDCEKRFRLIQRSVVQDLQMRHIGSSQMAKSTNDERERRRKDADERLTILEADVSKKNNALADDLKGRQVTLDHSIAHGISRAKGTLEHTLQRWRGMHWGTIRAVVRRDGRYHGTNGLSDFPLDLARPVLDTITLVWTDFFGREITQCLSFWTNQLLDVAERDHSNILLIAGVNRSGETVERGELDGLLEEELMRLRRQMVKRIERDQCNLYDTLPDQIKEQMLPAFRSAALENGSGVKQRMIDTLADHARSVAPDMFRAAEEAIINGVKELSATLLIDFADMTQRVLAQAKSSRQKLIFEGTSDADIAQARETSIRFNEALASITSLASASMDGSA